MFVTAKMKRKGNLQSETKRKKLFFHFASKRNEKLEAKRSENKRKIGPLFSLEKAKTKRNGSSFALFRFDAKKNFKRNRRTLLRIIYTKAREINMVKCTTNTFIYPS
jgi:hypothetical protein